MKLLIGVSFFLIYCSTKDKSMSGRSENAILKIDPCFGIEFGAIIDSVIIHTKEELKPLDDNCFMVLMDSIVQRCITKSQGKSFVCLDSISSVSDGFRSEESSLSTVKIFKNNPVGLLSYLQANKHKSTLLKSLTGGLSEEFSSLPVGARSAKIRDFEQQQVNSLVAKKADKNLIDFFKTSIVKKINPAMFD